MPKPLLTPLVSLQVRLQQRLTELRRNPDRGSHATEYAIGIGAAAAVVLGLFLAYEAGLQDIVESWDFL